MSVFIEYRAVVHFLFLKGLNNASILQELEDVYGQGCVTIFFVKKWTNMFSNGRESVEDLPRAGRPKIDGLVPRIQEILDEVPFISTKQLSLALGHHHATVKKVMIEEMGLKKVNFKWIPHKLTERNTDERVCLSHQLLAYLSKYQHSNIITMDETWVYFDNPPTSLWQDAELPRPHRVSRDIGAKKAMFTVFWSASRVFLVEMLPAGQTFTKQYFISLIDKLVDAINQTRAKSGTNGMFIHMDNARPHLIPEKLDQVGLKRIPHPAYSPDLAPSDFFLFGFMKHQLQGNSFGTHEELFTAVRLILGEIPKETLAAAYASWVKRLGICIDTQGEYI